LLLLYGSEHLLTLSPHPLLLCSAITSIDKTLEETQAIYNTVNTVVTTTLTPAVDAFNTSDPNSMAEKAVKIVDNVLDKLYDANRKVIVYELTMRDYTDEYRGYLSYKTQAMSGLFALPALFFILCIIINYYCSKRSWHLCCSMCVAYICLILFGIVALVISTLSVVTNLACDNRDWFVHKVPTKHMTVNGADFTIGPDTVNAILHCPAGINATADNNFVDILGVGKIFNISKQVDQGMAQVETMKSSFTPDTSIRKGLAKLTSVSNSSTFNVSKVAPIGPFISQLESFITTLPPQGMSKTDTTAQQQLIDYYFTSNQNFFVDFQTQLTTINTILGAATDVAPDRTSYNFTTIENFKQADVTPTTSKYNINYAGTNPAKVVYGTAGDDVTLSNALQQTDGYTTTLDAVIASNDVVVANLTALLHIAYSIQTSIHLIDGAQSAVMSGKDAINGSLWNMLLDANDIADGLDNQLANIRSVVAFTETVNDYTLCGFIGDFYVNTVEGVICDQFQTSLNMTWPCMITAILLLFLIFATLACYVSIIKGWWWWWWE